MARQVIKCLKAQGLEAVYIPKRLRGTRRERVAAALTVLALIHKAPVLVVIDGYAAIAAWPREEGKGGG